MHSWLFISVFGSALLGWLFVRFGTSRAISGHFLKGFDLSFDGSQSGMLVGFFENRVFSADLIKDKLLSPESYQRLVPQVESHIDHFLRVRLKEEMPVVGMMIGDRTINQMKAIFLKELAQLFPEVMQTYLDNLRTDQTIGNFLVAGLQGSNLAEIEDLMRPLLQAELRELPYYGALAGLLIGLFQALIFFLSTP